MRKHEVFRSFRVFVGAVLLAAGATTLSGQEPEAGPTSWPSSPYRSFGPARALSATVVLRDEADDPMLRQALAAEVERLSSELFADQGWPSPFTSADPLRILVTRRDAGGVRRLAARSIEGRRLASATLQIDGTSLSDAEIVREAGRLYARAAISTYGVGDGSFLTDAASEFLSEGGDPPEDIEAVTVAAAAPMVRVADEARAVGRWVLEEFAAAAGGRSALRSVWERASERGEEPLTSLSRIYAERTGSPEEALLLRAAARMYASIETVSAPASVGLYDLEAGALDASAPAAWSLRHRVFLPVEAPAALRFRWPAGASVGAAVVRYRDPELPPDVLFLGAEGAHALSLSGVARIDWIVAGSAAFAGSSAPVFFEPASGYPFEGLQPHAASGPGGSRITWTTASHEGLAGWAVFREEVEPDGRIALAPAQIVPATSAAVEPFGYAYVDAATRPGAFYRYSVWAVTEEGLLARAFSATLRAPE
jgi:hypothetical protein